MTEERVAELRKLEEAAARLPWSPKFVELLADNEEQYVFIVAARKELPCLLDEREALLVALKDAKAKLGDARSILSHCWAHEEPPDKESVDDADAAEDAAEAAVAKAEAP
jgi:hypothetical protein